MPGLTRGMVLSSVKQLHSHCHSEWLAASRCRPCSEDARSATTCSCCCTSCAPGCVSSCKSKHGSGRDGVVMVTAQIKQEPLLHLRSSRLQLCLLRCNTHAHEAFQPCICMQRLHASEFLTPAAMLAPAGQTLPSGLQCQGSRQRGCTSLLPCSKQAVQQ